MHRSRLAGFIIDCETADIGRAAAFWSAALGLERKAPSPDSRYIELDASAAGLHVEIQRVDHPSRVHLDIEADDVEAEVRRLEALGARRLGPVNDWVVMVAPTGQKFCVVPAESSRFDETANEWD